MLSAWIRGSPDHVFWTREVSRQTHSNKHTHTGMHAEWMLEVALPGTSIIFLYTFKKAFSASLLLLLNASICKERKKLIVSYTTT